MSKKYVAYYRVSTDGQGFSGLGLEAQRKIVTGAVGEPSREFIEVESGKKTNRPKLDAAIRYCKKNAGILVVAKLDRLGRKAKHLYEIKESIELVACDIPQMDSLLFGIFASFAQSEGERISERTRAALEAKKAQGWKLGSPENLTDLSREISAKVRRKLAQERNFQVYCIAKDLYEQGWTITEIARRLNGYGLTGGKGGKLYPTSVNRILALYETRQV